MNERDAWLELSVAADVEAVEAVSEIMQKEELNAVLGTLTHRERKVIELRFGLKGEHPRTLEEVGQKFGVTRERIRQSGPSPTRPPPSAISRRSVCGRSVHSRPGWSTRRTGPMPGRPISR